MKMILSIEDYDNAETEALENASYPAIRGFAPTTFHRDGTPTRAKTERGLRKFIDMMGEIRGFDGWDKALFSLSEAEEIKYLRAHVETITRYLFNEPITPVCNLLSPWPVLRAVRHLALHPPRQLRIFEIAAGLALHPPRQLRIFEIAAGCGYLGAYLIQDGYDYTGTDVTQGLYLWQNRLWDSIGMHRQIPWWEFADHTKLPSADIVICDSALGEMGWFGYEYVLNAATKMIGNTGYFIFSNIGDHAHRLPDAVYKDLIKRGLERRFITPQNVHFWSRNPTRIAKMDRPNGIQLSTLNLIPEQLPPNYAFLRFAGLC